jgi:hypothetical protein
LLEQQTWTSGGTFGRKNRHGADGGLLHDAELHMRGVGVEQVVIADDVERDLALVRADAREVVTQCDERCKAHGNTSQLTTLFQQL